jgi:hypothetical protein
MRLVMTCIVLGLLVSGPAIAETERSTRWAYAAGAAGVLVPGWLGTALIPTPGEGDEPRANPRTIAAMAGLYASLAWGTSAGYLYSGNTRYAVAGGLGKTALLGAGIGASLAFEADGHPYLLASSVALITTWSLVDYALLYRDVRRQNERRALAARVPIAEAVAPGVIVSNRAWTLTLSGRY